MVQGGVIQGGVVQGGVIQGGVVQIVVVQCIWDRFCDIWSYGGVGRGCVVLGS